MSPINKASTKKSSSHEHLSQETCEACHSGAPKVADDELSKLLKEVPLWRTENRDGVLQLERQFSVKNFAEALELAKNVGELAESANHHPSILVEWGKVTVTWWTHKIGGLHRNDFIMASRTDKLLTEHNYG
jgi:4a-hydroxytetrahydrobiopterin dehydratase